MDMMEIKVRGSKTTLLRLGWIRKGKDGELVARVYNWHDVREGFTWGILTGAWLGFIIATVLFRT